MRCERLGSTVPHGYALRVAEQHWVEVDGLVLPRPVAGHPALELVNTFSGWDGTHASDYLETYDHLAVLAGELDLLPAGDVQRLRRAAHRQPEAAAAALERACTVRAVIRDAALDPSDGEAVGALTVATRSAATGVQLVPGHPARWRVQGISPDDLDRPSDAFAWVAADLVTRPEVARVRACPGLGCGWVFLDTSGRRRWCSMAWCGNRAKVRAHAERTRSRR
ncbi:CGNR zinc finger domain-containing protein [Phycicoccus sp. MAQZ13P-2]|nr:CGNR zinc finger domain-containing protein [Phycicoccus mangrovi]MBT9275038.1 CGNR zinc finger domain-containing protein [Phycicoccus mangrovi]